MTDIREALAELVDSLSDIYSLDLTRLAVAVNAAAPPSQPL